MFGLGEQKGDKKSNFEFELEKELTDPSKQKEIRTHIEDRIEELKKILREGENKKEFERFGLILHGYTSLIKVMDRFKSKTK